MKPHKDITVCQDRPGKENAEGVQQPAVTWFKAHCI